MENIVGDNLCSNRGKLLGNNHPVRIIHSHSPIETVDLMCRAIRHTNSTTPVVLRYAQK